jgi:hypothetical protein
MKASLQQIGFIIGLIGGLISIPRGLVDTYQTMFKRPDLHIEPTTDQVLFTYTPQWNKLIISFGMILLNKGNDSEAIESCSAYLGVPSDAARSVSFTNREIIFKENGHPSPMNDPIQEGTRRLITCEITTDATEKLHAIFGEYATTQRLVIDCYGQNHRFYPGTKIDLDFSGIFTASLFDSSLQEPKTVSVYPSNLK